VRISVKTQPLGHYPNLTSLTAVNKPIYGFISPLHGSLKCPFSMTARLRYYYFFDLIQ